MNTWGLTDGDLSLSDGTINVKSDIDCLADRINAMLNTIIGETDNSDVGVDYYNIIFARTPLSLKVSEFCRAIRLVDGVEDVHFIQCTTDNNGTWTFQFEIQSVYGNIDIEKQVENGSI